MPYSPSSKSTLSPKTITSNSLLSINRLRISRLGRLRAFDSRAQTPMIPIDGSEMPEHVSVEWLPHDSAQDTTARRSMRTIAVDTTVASSCTSAQTAICLATRPGRQTSVPYRTPNRGTLTAKGRSRRIARDLPLGKYRDLPHSGWRQLMTSRGLSCRDECGSGNADGVQ